MGEVGGGGGRGAPTHTQTCKAAKRIMLSGRGGLNTNPIIYGQCLILSGNGGKATSIYAYSSHRHSSMSRDNYTPRKVCNNSTAGCK